MFHRRKRAGFCTFFAHFCIGRPKTSQQNRKMTVKLQKWHHARTDPKKVVNITPKWSQKDPTNGRSAKHIRPSGVQNLQNSGFIFRFSLLPALSTVSTSLSSLIYVTYIMLYWIYTMSAHTPVLYLNCPSLHPSLLSAPFLSIPSALQCLCSPYASAFGDFFCVYLALGYTRRPIFI